MAYKDKDFFSEKNDDLHEELIESSTVYTGKIFSVTEDQVCVGKDIRATRNIVHHNGGVAILAIDGLAAWLVKQYRAGVSQVCYELPAGKLEKGEDVLEAAKRELKEEVGAEADFWEYLGVSYPTPAYDSERIYLFLARGLHYTHQHLDVGEILYARLIDWPTVLAKITDNTIRDSKTVHAISLYNLKTKC